MMTFKVRETSCATCIYRKDSPLCLKDLEDAVKDKHGFFQLFRSCHHHPDKVSRCCRGFWNAHKDDFPLGQITQRLNLVEFSDEGDHGY